ncbi:hypothetical protein Gogos_019345 [Gossypium gossypioides]|uniref:Uncharacterized protein n=1 Tax=Gossypium gossypioides TaxID=34282 RepID=A0A7J9BH59_GOSGO|nr:hypothetical protein [Gossypium gossypioides]
MDAFVITPLNAQGASLSSSSFMVALPLMTMVMSKMMPRTGTEDFVQSDVNNMDPMKRIYFKMDIRINQPASQSGIIVHHQINRRKYTDRHTASSDKLKEIY